MCIKFIRSLLYHANMSEDLYYLSNESFTLEEMSTRRSLNIKEKSKYNKKEGISQLNIIEYERKRKRFSIYNSLPIFRMAVGKRGWDVLK